MKIVPTDHTEQHLPEAGKIIIHDTEDMNKSRDFKIYTKCKNLSYNDMWITFIDRQGQTQYIELDEKHHLTIFPPLQREDKNLVNEEFEKQINIFEILGGV